ncbi:alpha-1,3-mannosyl-glycoprotein 4-beta-N-acetylglucosaminyltransferase-like protein MGAT4D isoform X1 [Erinaceus europaeus]|uniref:Alpha-1,3-mannosyl-glycoprotein 4-beta-N-acetylglucosaminyltransferase-like protein MGAT4D isoform X1 n=1 Tax=Erinaceus europaeus TaxID=9365 RepID=A0ABM3WEN7_ERIEU|nr:alpha-1,3-mannosyl-glycoprotein 4-beta-N-acetylglucosaminyltransferase-like protein MGAT4D isoform X1 [Erinaceus europaeus]
MRTKQVNLLTSLVAAVLFSFSCFCISRMTQLSNQLINCRNHILEFKDNILHLRNKSEKTHQELSVAFSQIKNQFPGREHLSVHSAEKKVDENGAGSKLFEVLKYFFPHLRKVDRIYPDVILSKEKTGASFALGISTVNRGNHSYLKQTLTSLLSRMALSEEKDCVVIVSVADSNGEYLKSVVDMVTKKFQRQLRAGSLEVISIPTFFYPSTFQDKPSTELSQRLHHWQMKQLLDFCFLMLYAQPKATYYLQLEDDIIAKKKYLTQITDFIHNITSNNWFYIEFSAIGFIGKLFKSEDLIDFVQFFLMFYKDKPIDLLLGEIFRIKMCRSGESPEKCLDRNKDTHIYYKPSLFQHVGTRSSFSEKTQYLKKTLRS